MDHHGFESGDVVSIKGFREAMTYSPIAEVEAYWEALRGVRTIPLRSEIDPRGIERALDRTFLLERIAPGLARFRLAGQKLNDLMGMEVRGMPLTSMLTPESRDGAREALNHLFEGPKVVKLSLVGEKGIGRPAMRGQAILLPLRSDLGDISRALGCIVFDTKIGRTPRRFDVEAITYREIGPFRTPQPEAAPDETPAFAEDASKFAHKPKAKRPATHLRLVKPDED